MIGFRSDRFVGENPFGNSAGQPEPVRGLRRVRQRDRQQPRRVRQILSGRCPVETTIRFRQRHQRSSPSEKQFDRREHIRIILVYIFDFGLFEYPSVSVN